MSIVDQNAEEKLFEVVRASGKKIMEFWPGSLKTRGLEGLHVIKKEDGSYVTQADHLSNDLITAKIRELFPSDGILSEESPIDPDISKKERIWVIDPLDGTQSFIDGNDDFSILLALCNKGAAQFGIMYFPARDVWAVARKGLGATQNTAPMHVSKSKAIRPLCLYLRHFPTSPPGISDQVFPRWLDSGMAVLSLCKGDLDGLIVRITTHKEWDLAVAAVLIEESGGKVTDEHGKKILFGSGEIKFKYFVASNGQVHKQLLERIA